MIVAVLPPETALPPATGVVPSVVHQLEVFVSRFVPLVPIVIVAPGENGPEPPAGDTLGDAEVYVPVIAFENELPVQVGIYSGPSSGLKKEFAAVAQLVS
jgi:hypothetical protein